MRTFRGLSISCFLRAAHFSAMLGFGEGEISLMLPHMTLI